MVLALLAGIAHAVLPAEAIASAVSARAGVPATDVEVSALGLPATALVDGAWGVELPPGLRKFTGSTPVTLSRPDGARFAVRPRIVTFSMVPVAQLSVRAGEPVALAQARVASDVLRSEDPVGEGRWVARVALAAGDPVTVSRVRQAPDLGQGADVKLTAGSGPLVVAAPGRLMADAYVGAPVSVLNLATRAVLKGTYRGNHVVALEGP
jgi:hypothetical protein